ncbi:SDR family oxidoreductase [Cupriavidus pauculus]|uniref:SDR family oxidoreductase n=1 Tax=Cupriavidus pauculus TaxID=82633 RepID=UPI0015DE5CD0|nr:SDR family oxidoreductase [Cupriavidus pauculus]
MNSPTAKAARAALVFGGSRGIGAAIATRLAQDGFHVALTYATRPDKAAEVVARIEAAGGQGLAIAADSADPAAIRAAVRQAVARFGPLDAAVVNAGVLRLGTIDTVADADLGLMLDVNIRGVFVAIQAAAAQVRDGGHLITIGSNTAIRTGAPGGAVYAMTKAAVAALVKNVALELAPRGITINNIQPGPTVTDMTAEMVEHLIPKIPLGRVGRPEEIAGLASWLASPASAYMTGASLTIDGGYVL